MKLNGWRGIWSDGDVLLTPHVSEGITGYDDNDDDDDAILPSNLRSWNWSPSLRFPHQTSVCTYPVPRMCYVMAPSHSPWCHHPNIIWCGQIIKLLVKLSSPRPPPSPLPCPLKPKHLPQHPIFEHPQPMFLRHVEHEYNCGLALLAHAVCKEMKTCTHTRSKGSELIHLGRIPECLRNLWLVLFNT